MEQFAGSEYYRMKESNVPSNKTRNLIAVVILVHFAVVMVHGAAHSHLHIELAPAQMIYVVAVIVFAPLVAGGLLWTRFWRSGAYLLTISMIGALVFGGYKHFLSATNDDVAQMQHVGWGGVFLVSSILLFVTESAGILLGFRAAAITKAVS
ncbi:MAG TPA: hypothetical protein VG488_01500 [Candidatus Angelobacter sp.]|nr:hypothetical protein [Candidatus Angelobacter sp.]